MNEVGKKRHADYPIGDHGAGQVAVQIVLANLVVLSTSARIELLHVYLHIGAKRRRCWHPLAISPTGSPYLRGLQFHSVAVGEYRRVKKCPQNDLRTGIEKRTI